MITLENYLRRNGDGTPTTYWGYAAPGSDVSAKVWSIRRLITDGSDDYMQFADDNFEFNKRWDERTLYFAAPASAVTLIASGASYNSINLQWVHIPGVPKYTISVLDLNGKTVGMWNKQTTIYEAIVIDGLANITTYKIIIVASNAYGQTTATFNITTQ